jgi:predicted  nucleic acid-binding Zn-ribbon protein
MQFKTFQAFHEGFNYVDEINNELNNSMKEYHESMKKIQDLQSKFISTPKEKINEREAMKQQLIQANRNMIEKQGNFYAMLAEIGDGDIFDYNVQQ